jgi:chromosome segregation ATPase
MARGITATDVWQAADELLLDGQRPTIERVRQKIGRGSPNTVSPHLDDWFAQLGQRLDSGSGQGGGTQQPALLPMAPGLEAPEPWVQTAHQLWSQALSLSLSQVRQQLEQEMSSRHEALKAQVEALREREAALDKAQADLAARIDGFERALALGEQQRVDLIRQRDQSAAQLAVQTDQIATLQVERDQAQRALQAQQRDAVQERQRLEQRSIDQERYWQLEVERSREHTRSLSQELDTSRQELSRLRSELQERIRSSESDISRLQAALQQALERAQTQLEAHQRQEDHQERDPIRRLKRRRQALERV